MRSFPKVRTVLLRRVCLQNGKPKYFVSGKNPSWGSLPHYNATRATYVDVIKKRLQNRTNILAKEKDASKKKITQEEGR